MADPTQNDANKKPAGDGAAKPVPAKEEVSAADLLSLWGGGAPASASAKPEPKPELKPESKPELKLEEPEPKPKPKPRPKPKIEPKLKPKLEEPESKPESRSAPMPISKPAPVPSLMPKPMPPPLPAEPVPSAPTPPAPAPLPPEPAPAPKIIQPETAFWEIPKQSPPMLKTEPPSPPSQPSLKPQIPIAPTVHIEEPPIPKPKPVPPPPPAPSLPPIAPKKEPVAEPIEEPKVEPKPKPKVKIDSDIFEETPPPPPVKKNEKTPKEIFEGEIVVSKTSSPLPPEPPSSEEPQNLNEENGLGSQVDEFLEELNLSRKHIFYGIGCLVLIIVLIFGGILGYKFYKNRAPSEPKPEQQQQQQPQSKEPATVPVSDTSTGVASTQELGKLLDPNLVGFTGINSTAAMGVELTGSSGISNYIMTFKRLQNAYETDINELLNQATDRRGRLNSHLALLGKFYVDGTLINSQIQQEAEQIKIQYEEKKKVQQTHDSNFFDQIKALNPQTTENLLSDFISVSKEIVVLRARFKALQKVKSYYNFALPKLNARIKDIELNAEALILGLKIYDVKGSDLKLIIPIESSAGATQNESLESSSGSGLFINPASVSTGHDYIQKPGGGF